MTNKQVFVITRLHGGFQTHSKSMWNVEKCIHYLMPTEVLAKEAAPISALQPIKIALPQ